MFYTHVLREWVWPRAHKRDDHYPICSKLHYGCLLALYGPTSTMYVATLCGVFPDNFFFCLVCQSRLLEKKKKKKTMVKFSDHYKSEITGFTVDLCCHWHRVQASATASESFIEAGSSKITVNLVEHSVFFIGLT